MRIGVHLIIQDYNRLGMKELAICVCLVVVVETMKNKEVGRVLANFVFPLNRHKDFMVIRAPDQRQTFILYHS